MIRELAQFPGYGASADGRIWRTVRTSRRHVTIPQEIKQRPAKDGYPAVVLFRDGKRHFVVVHRLILAAFVGPCPAGMVAAHNDGVKTHNAATNLRWCTQRENIADKASHGTLVRGERVNTSKLSADQVCEIRDAPYFRGLFSELARKYGVSRVAIRNVYDRKSWSHL